MSRKTLLTETEVRQFLKLANIGPVGDVKIQELYGEVPGARDEEGPDDMGADVDMGMDLGAEEEVDDLDPEAELDADDGLDDTVDAGAGMVSVEDFMSALENALEDVLNDDVAVEMDDEEALDDEDALDDEEALGGAPEDLEGAPLGLDDEEPDPMMEEDIVNEVAKRVAARLQQKQNKENMVDALSERIMKRLTSK